MRRINVLVISAIFQPKPGESPIAANAVPSHFGVVNTVQTKEVYSGLPPFALSTAAPSNCETVPAASTKPWSMALVPRSTSDWERLAKEAAFRSAKMASLCSVSERHFQRLFKKHLGCSPTQWLRMLQCRLAKELISQGYSSKAAAVELKFATNSHFCREFKKVFGVSPQSFAPNHLGYLSLAGLTGNGSGITGNCSTGLPRLMFQS